MSTPSCPRFRKIAGLIAAVADLFELIQPPLIRIALALVFFYGLFKITLAVLMAHAE